MRYKPGSVVWAVYPYKDENGVFIPKERPVLVVDYDGDTDRYVCKITSSDISKYTDECHKIEVESDLGIAFGLSNDSFLDMRRQVSIPVSFIRRQIGFCPDDFWEELGFSL